MGTHRLVPRMRTLCFLPWFGSHLPDRYLWIIFLDTWPSRRAFAPRRQLLALLSSPGASFTIPLRFLLACTFSSSPSTGCRPPTCGKAGLIMRSRYWQKRTIWFSWHAGFSKSTCFMSKSVVRITTRCSLITSLPALSSSGPTIITTHG